MISIEETNVMSCLKKVIIFDVSISVWEKNKSIGQVICMTEAEKRMKRCCFTGHRPGKLRQDEHTVKQALETAIDRAISRGFTTFITGMAQGTDIWAAEIVLEKRIGNPALKLICILPHPDFEKFWNAEWQYRYSAIRSAADLERTICPSYTKTAYQKRNIWMVDHSALVIAVFNGKSGGTLNTIRYAQQNQIEILYAV